MGFAQENSEKEHCAVAKIDTQKHKLSKFMRSQTVLMRADLGVGLLEIFYFLFVFHFGLNHVELSGHPLGLLVETSTFFLKTCEGL